MILRMKPRKYASITRKNVQHHTRKQGYIFWPFTPILSQLKNREEFEGGLEKRRGKGGKRRKKGRE